MIIIKLMGGLGNQLFQYAVGRILSERTGTEMKLDISFFESSTIRSYKLSNYNIKAEPATAEEVKSLIGSYGSKKLPAIIVRLLEKITAKSKRKYFLQNDAWAYEPALFVTSSNVYIDGIWQHHKYIENISDYLFSELMLKEPLPVDVQQMLDKIEQAPNAVSIHIRRGDYLSNTKANTLFGVLPMQYYIAAIEYIRQKADKPQFFIFSDDLNWAKENFTFASPLFFVDSGKDYLDLLLMSKCKHNIIANSSFSWWGAVLNRNSEKIVICTKQWVISNEINSRIEIQLPSWIKI